MSRRSFVSFALASTLLVACEGTPRDATSVSSAEAPLLLAQPRWPNGVVPVCWTALSMSHPDFDSLSREVRDVLDGSWPMVADIEFTGWGPCPEAPVGMVAVTLRDATWSNSTVGYSGPNAEHFVNLGTLRSDFYEGLIPHEFGHVLGFAHEMSRADFEDTGAWCRDVDVEGDTLDTPPDRASITASSGYCNANDLLSHWDIVGARVAYGPRADNVVSSGRAFFARSRSSGDIFRRSGSGWTRIGGPGGQFVVAGGRLYGLALDGMNVYRYARGRPDWTWVGGPAKEIFACAGHLCATDPATGEVRRLEGRSWQTIGGPGAMFASTADTLYRLSVARDAIDEYSGSGAEWRTIGGPASFLYSTTESVFAVSRSTGEILEYDGTGTRWSTIGGPGRLYVGVGATLYALGREREGIWQYTGSGTSWARIGGAADWLYGGAEGSLYATSPTTKDIYRFTGSGWVNEGQP